MTDPAVVQGFLDVGGDWNPALLGVMGGAVAVTWAGYRLVFRRARPALAGAFVVPPARSFSRSRRRRTRPSSASPSP